MPANHFSWNSFFIRLGFALILVYATYNPSGYSFFHWTKEAFFGEAMEITPPLALSGVVLLIGWAIYIRATLRSLGTVGVILALAFFGILVWWMVNLGLLGVDSVSVFAYVILFILAAILATGMSWAHIRRRMSGQADVDEVDE